MTQSQRLTLSATVEIRAEAAEVFAVVNDLRRKARLNPNIQVIRVELEGEEPLREGSISVAGSTEGRGSGAPQPVCAVSFPQVCSKAGVRLIHLSRLE